jgi:hypothetical protein
MAGDNYDEQSSARAADWRGWRRAVRGQMRWRQPSQEHRANIRDRLVGCRGRTKMLAHPGSVRQLSDPCAAATPAFCPLRPSRAHLRHGEPAAEPRAVLERGADARRGGGCPHPIRAPFSICQRDAVARRELAKEPHSGERLGIFGPYMRHSRDLAENPPDCDPRQPAA